MGGDGGLQPRCESQAPQQTYPRLSSGGFIIIAPDLHPTKVYQEMLIPVYIATISPDTILISISGTNATNDISILIDLDILLVPPDEEFFPGATGNGVLVSKGYHEAFQRIRALISATVLDRVGRGVSRVMVVGHSMGGSLSPLLFYLSITNTNP